MAANTLRRELIGAFAVISAGAVMVAVVGAVLLTPTFDRPSRAVIYLLLLLAGDLAVFFVFGRWLIRTRILFPLDRMLEEAEAIAAGDYGRRLPRVGAEELDRLSESLNRMAERLITHQFELARNVQSLEHTNRDLTEARDELIRAEKMASLGQMAAGVAHEVGNPLAAIVGNLDLLKRRAEGRALQLVESSAEQAHRIDRIVGSLLDYSRVREARVRPIDVNAVVAKTLELVTAQRRFGGVRVETALEEPIPAVAADPYQLEQVLVNLLLNAADAMEGRDERQVLIATTHRAFESPAHVPARRADDPPGIDYSHRRRFNRPERVPRTNLFEAGAPIVELMVADSGPGIPPEVMGRIFEPFMTTKEPGKGTGLGLAVSARLIDGMGGTIQATNGEGGAVFRVLLPASEQPAEAHP
ncbi:MAG TPA: ATP-binding protein [Longimicrobiales bacterium]|nr:ATP-binding protein [Longimicrobiales bacterium]